MITFIGLKGRSAGLIRGIQISQEIPEGNFFDHGEVLQNIEKIHKHVIVVRNRLDHNIEKLLKDNGHIVGYDILDYAAGEFYFRKNPVNYKNHVSDSVFDFYIVNNNHTRDLVSNVTNKIIYVIPHHHVNDLNYRAYDGYKKIERAGYLGLSEQLTHKDEIRDIFEKYNISFETCEAKTKEECVEFLKSIQIGITHMKNKYTDVFSEIKPNTKLTNYQSFGIIPLCDDYKSFREFGRSYYLMHDSLDSLEENLNKVLGSQSFRNRISDLSYENSKSFNLKNVVDKHYIQKILKEMNA